MRLLAYGLILGLLAGGCGSAASNDFGSAGGTSGGGYGGASGTTGSWTSNITGSGGGVAFNTGSGTSGTSTAASSSSSSSGASSGSSSSSSSGDAGSIGSGECHADSDCSSTSGHCVAVTPGGFSVCLTPPVPATTCNGAADQCCPTKEPCPDNEPCYAGPLVPVCAGLPTPPHNQCAVDQCAKDVDCAAGQICALAGTFGLEIRACMAAYCKLDTDCNAQPGGMCAPVEEPCCSASAGLFCVYQANGGCRSNAECPPIAGHPSRYCAPDPVAGVASCQDGGPVCPA